MKKLIVVLPLLIALVGSSQSFFKPLPKPAVTSSMKGAIASTAAITQNVIRPIANIASYAVPDNLGLTGVGISWQHQEYSTAEDRWKVLYSINALTWYSTQQTVLYGLAIGALNNLIMVGVATDSHKFYGTVGIGINFNN